MKITRLQVYILRAPREDRPHWVSHFIVPRANAAGQDSVWVVQVVEKAEARQIEPEDREKLKDRALEDWLEEERKANTVERYFNSDRYEFAVQKIREYNPPQQNQQQGQAQGGPQQ